MTRDTETLLDYSSTSPREVDNDFGALIRYTMRNKSNLEPQYENRVRTELWFCVTAYDLTWKLGCYWPRLCIICGPNGTT
jgi:hypothetical protein